MIRVLIVEDHQMVLDSFVRMFDREDDFEVVGTASTLESAEQAIQTSEADVVMLDYNLPDGNGIDFASRILAARPEAKLLLVTGEHDDRNLLPRALAAGCCGYVEKTAAFSDLAEAVRSADRGEVVVPPRMVPGWWRAVERLRLRKNRIGRDVADVSTEHGPGQSGTAS
jgi:DNA-binding NarL/FixJ family response regulator